jgi:hypothetical protein
VNCGGPFQVTYSTYVNQLIFHTATTPFTYRYLVGLAGMIEGKMVNLDMSLSELTARAYARALPARKVSQELREDIIIRQLT